MRAWQLSTIEKLCDKNCKYYVDLVEELTEARAFGWFVDARQRRIRARPLGNTCALPLGKTRDVAGAIYAGGRSRLRLTRAFLTRTSISSRAGLAHVVCLPGRCWLTFSSRILARLPVKLPCFVASRSWLGYQTRGAPAPSNEGSRERR
jgi:hypothetical protein